MKRIISVLIACILVIALVGCSGNSNGHEGEAKTPSGSSAQKGSDYQKVIDNFKEKGFKNIKTETLEDLVTGWMTKDGEVEAVSVDGNKDYSPDVWYPNEVEVVIAYHTFPTDKAATVKDEKTAKSSEESNSTVLKYYNDTKDSVGNTEQEKIYARRMAAYKVAQSQPDVVLTVDNNTELAALLQLKDPGDSSIEEFALNYYSWTIEFDGNIANVMNYENFDHYFNVLVGAGDYSETGANGPNFQFKDIGSNQYPDSVVNGKNVHVKATVGAYDEVSQLFELTPISIEAR